MRENLGNLEEEEYYALPDGECLMIGDERFKCCEIAFKPEMFGTSCPPLHNLVIN